MRTDSTTFSALLVLAVISLGTSIRAAPTLAGSSGSLVTATPSRAPPSSVTKVPSPPKTTTSHAPAPPPSSVTKVVPPITTASHSPAPATTVTPPKTIASPSPAPPPSSRPAAPPKTSSSHSPAPPPSTPPPAPPKTSSSHSPAPPHSTPPAAPKTSSSRPQAPPPSTPPAAPPKTSSSRPQAPPPSTPPAAPPKTSSSRPQAPPPSTPPAAPPQTSPSPQAPPPSTLQTAPLQTSSSPQAPPPSTPQTAPPQTSSSSLDPPLSTPQTAPPQTSSSSLDPPLSTPQTAPPQTSTSSSPDPPPNTTNAAQPQTTTSSDNLSLLRNCAPQGSEQCSFSAQNNAGLQNYNFIMGSPVSNCLDSTTPIDSEVRGSVSLANTWSTGLNAGGVQLGPLDIGYSDEWSTTTTREFSQGLTIHVPPGKQGVLIAIVEFNVTQGLMQVGPTDVFSAFFNQLTGNAEYGQEVVGCNETFTANKVSSPLSNSALRRPVLSSMLYVSVVFVVIVICVL